MFSPKQLHANKRIAISNEKKDLQASNVDHQVIRGEIVLLLRQIKENKNVQKGKAYQDVANGLVSKSQKSGQSNGQARSHRNEG